MDRHERRMRHARRSSSSRRGNTSGDDLMARDEFIQVELLQDDQWAENTTCVTGNTSERSISYEDLRYLKSARGEGAAGAAKLGPGQLFMHKCGAVCSLMVAAGICLFAYLSPIAMVILPQVRLLPNWEPDTCGVACEGLLISFGFKLAILAFGMWACYGVRSLANLPRVFVSRSILLAIVFLATFAFWLFYGVRILQRRDTDYKSCVSFALSLVDLLLFIHYLSVIVLQIRHLRPEYKIRVVRSPDGESRTYSIGQLSIQRAAQMTLQYYYRDFPVFNPFLERLPGAGGGDPKRSGKKDRGGSQVSVGSRSNNHHGALTGPGGASGENPLGFKVYDVDGDGSAPPPINPQAIIAAAARKRDSSHNDRFYEEIEYDRRVKKRKARLVTAAEEAFMHVKRLHEEKGPCVPMDAQEAAQAIFPSLARSLQKYLRISRQQPRHSAEQIVHHMAQCLSYDMSPRAFLERFFNTQETHEASQSSTSWSIVCPQLVSRPVSHGVVFQLRCHSPGPDAGVFLLVSVTRLPFFDLTEDVMDAKKNQFVLRLNSETSV